MDIIEVTKEVVGFIYGKNRESREKAIAYLEMVKNICFEAVTIQDPNGPGAILLHERLKAIYDTASKSFPYDFDNEGSDSLFRALSAARAYYWLRRWESDPKLRHNELAEIVELREDIFRGSSPDLLAGWVRRYLEDYKIPEKNFRDTFEYIRPNCFREVALLEAYVMELKTAK